MTTDEYGRTLLVTCARCGVGRVWGTAGCRPCRVLDEFEAALAATRRSWAEGLIDAPDAVALFASHSAQAESDLLALGVR